VGIPTKLSEAGVKRDQIDRLVQIATDDACHPNNPRSVTAEDFRRIFNDAL
jgi:alcohol dehydrogenase class IV